MDTRWTYSKKHDENGTFTKNRSRLVAKGFTQILGVNYFESFSPVASFVTIRTLFALTALPMFKVYQYDVEVAFIQSSIDSNHPPVYCTPAEGYEDRRQYVYQLHKHLHSMKDSPRGWSKLFSSVCLTYGFSQLKSDECVFVKIVPNTKSGKSANTFSAVLDTLPNVPERNRIYKDCPYESRIIILCSYVTRAQGSMSTCSTLDHTRSTPRQKQKNTQGLTYHVSDNRISIRSGRQIPGYS